MSAPRQLAKRQKLDRKRRRKQEATRRRKSKQQSDLGPGDFFDSFPGGSGPFGGIKMSDVLQDFVGPWRDTAADYEEFSKLLLLGVVAWNVALVPEDQRAAFVDSAIDTAMKRASFDERQMARDLLDTFVARKLQYFDWCERPIHSYQLDKLEDGRLHLSVVSSLC